MPNAPFEINLTQCRWTLKCTTTKMHRPIMQLYVASRLLAVMFALSEEGPAVSVETGALVQLELACSAATWSNVGTVGDTLVYCTLGYTGSRSQRRAPRDALLYQQTSSTRGEDARFHAARRRRRRPAIANETDWIVKRSRT